MSAHCAGRRGAPVMLELAESASTSALKHIYIFGKVPLYHISRKLSVCQLRKEIMFVRRIQPESCYVNNCFDLETVKKW